MRNRAKHGDSILQEVGFSHLEEICHFRPVTAWWCHAVMRYIREITRRETHTDNKTNVRKCGTYAGCGRYKEINSLSVGKT